MTTPKIHQRTILIGGAILLLPVFIWLFWSWTSSPATLTTLTKPYQATGTEVKQDLEAKPSLTFQEESESYQITDTKDGIDIQFANQTSTGSVSGEASSSAQDSPSDSLRGSTSKLTLNFPKDYSKPLEIKLDDKRTIEITDLSGKGDYTVDTLSGEVASPETLSSVEGSSVEGSPTLGSQTKNLWERLLSLRGSTSKQDIPQQYLRYESQDKRKSLLYAFQKDQATGEKQLKHWTLYREGDGIEQESYQFTNSKVKITETGEAEVFYFGEQQISDEKVKAEVDTNLMARAQRTLQKELGEDILNNQNPDFTIPKPYYFDNQGEKHDGEWKWNDQTNTLSVNITPTSYPIALDPTLSFTAPGDSTTGSVITGESGSSFGKSLAAGDFNADGKTDLAVGATTYSSSTGRVYLFYNDGGIATTASNADVIITGEASSTFGYSLAAGDFNADGKTDLAVGAYGYSTNTGRAYLFYGPSFVSEDTTGADITLTGETTNNFFSWSLATGDYNADGKTDLVVGAIAYSTSTGRAYLFYGPSFVSEDTTGADITLTGGATSNSFGYSLATGDYNADGKTDLAVGASLYTTSTGRAYLFYGPSFISEDTTGADITLTGGATSNSFGHSLAAGDFNADGKTDLAVGAYGYTTSTGRVYLFYGGSFISEDTTGADITLTGETTNNVFGFSLATGDYNADGKMDLAVGAYGYSTSTGRAYIFYNDDSIPTTAATADVIITGETTNNIFGFSLATGDYNADGKMDLAVGAYGYASNKGRAYIFYSQNGQVNTNQSLTGGATSDYFGGPLVSGDFNADGKTDLAVSATGYTTNTGRVYLFYGPSFVSEDATGADITLTGEATANSFGTTLATGDFNADGKTDLAVSATGYTTNTGRVYLFYGPSFVSEDATGADITLIGGATGNFFGASLATGDFNADGKTDLAVSATGYSSSTGRVYLFYGGSFISEDTAGADITLTGGATTNSFGTTLATGDFNADGKVDLAVGARGYSSSTGRAYLFYGSSFVSETTTGADITLTGGATNDQFGFSLVSGDFNADGRTDLAVGAYAYTTNTGRVYLFYGGSFVSETTTGADITLTGETTNSLFGWSLATGDFNADGKTDLAVGADGYSSNTGRAYIFYSGSIITENASGADVIITGDTSNQFGWSFATGDYNADGRTDLVVAARLYSSFTGRVYIYETRGNFAWQIQKQFVPIGGSGLRTGLDTSGQELKITGETTSNQFGNSLAAGDFNADGRTDLAVGAPYFSPRGRVYIFYNDGSLSPAASSADVVIVGEDGHFGIAVAAGDLNADGKTDLAVGAYTYSFNTGRAYIFYNDGSLPTTAANADVIITGETTTNLLGESLTTGDFNADGKIDLAVGAPFNGASFNGRAYIFYNGSIITEAASGADVIIVGDTGVNKGFGDTFVVGDFNADGKTDLAVGGAFIFAGSAGRAYVFYNDGSLPTTAATADVIISGEAGSSFGYVLAAADLNADGKIDLTVSASYYSSSTGRAYIFYNDGVSLGTAVCTTGCLAANADVMITGETTNNYFGWSLATGDFNADGQTDLAVGASSYTTNTGRAYIFYNDGSIPTTAATADVILTGETTNNYYGAALAAGDFNNDGKTDLAVGAYGYASSTGRVYMYTFGNDPVITGTATTDYFGWSMTSGDLNADGKTDLAVGAWRGSSGTGAGRAYIFYNDGSISTTAASADAMISGEGADDQFAYSLATGDLNADGKTDLIAGANTYSGGDSTGRAYIFYNGSIITENASGADVIISGASSTQFGTSLVTGDLNADGTTDLAVGGNMLAGVVYLFYNDGSIPTTAATADITITGESSSAFGTSLITSDLNADGKIDLAVGASSYTTNTGRAYIFYNDGSIPTTAATADVIITGETTSNNFGISLATSDLNADGKTDLAVGAASYSSSTGRIYIFYNDGSIPTTAATADAIITGEASSAFGRLTSGDFNADGKTDLAVGASGYSSSTGRAYIFYNDGSIPTTAATADVIITGETTSNNFGISLIVGDLNADGKVDLAVGARGYSSSTGRVYIITSEAASPSVDQDISARTRGTLKTRGVVKVR